MKSFSVEFDSPMIAAVSADRNVRVSASKSAVLEPKNDPNQPTAAPRPVSNFDKTTTAIETALKDVLAELSSQQAAIKTTAANYAVEIVRVLLGSSDEIIETRLRQNVARVLDCPDAFDVAKLYVHSNERNGIEEWLLKSELFKSLDGTIEIKADDILEPGDCRVDFGQSGRLASLEEQLKLVESRLKQSIRDEQTGVQQ